MGHGNNATDVGLCGDKPLPDIRRPRPVRQHRPGTLIPNLPRGEDPVHTISSPILGQRPAELGERATCGRSDIVVFLGGQHGDSGYCGAPSARTDWAWCDQPRHEGRCPTYPLRPEVTR
jgi:hypothetical protein